MKRVDNLKRGVLLSDDITQRWPEAVNSIFVLSGKKIVSYQLQDLDE